MKKMRLLVCLLVAAGLSACSPEHGRVGTDIHFPPAGSVTASSVTTSALTVSGIADFQSTGITFSKTLTTPSTSSTTLVDQQYVYAFTIDCTTATGADKGTIAPARAGAIFVISRWCATVVTKTGTVTTVPLFNVGTNASSYNDWLSGTSSPLGTAGAINEGPGASGATNIVATNAAPVAGAAMHIGLAQAQVGASVLTVRVGLTGYWTTVP